MDYHVDIAVIGAGMGGEAAALAYGVGSDGRVVMGSVDKRTNTVFKSARCLPPSQRAKRRTVSASRR